MKIEQEQTLSLDGFKSNEISSWWLTCRICLDQQGDAGQTVREAEKGIVGQ